MEEVKDYPPYLDHPRKPKQITNADRIRAMSDEELAVFLEQLQADVAFNNNSKYAFEWEKWLKQPADQPEG